MTDQVPTEPTPIRRRRRRTAGSRKPSTRRPRASSTPNGYTATLRAALSEQVKPCHACGHVGGNKTQMAQQIGVSVMSLNKFLKGGRVNSDTVDAVHAYLNKS